MVQNFEPQNLHSRKKKKKKRTPFYYVYHNFPRKCDPLIYTYQSARFIFFFHEIFVNFSNFVLFCFLFFLYLVLFWFEYGQIQKKKKNQKQKQKKKQTTNKFYNICKF